MASQATVRLGDHLLPVVPQRHARLRRSLSAKDFEAIFTAKYSTESKRVLEVLIPALADIPLWEWEGFASQEDMDNDNYIEGGDRSPTTAEIVNAFEQSLMVSGADRLGKIMGLMETTGALQSVSQSQTPSSLESPGETSE